MHEYYIYICLPLPPIVGSSQFPLKFMITSSSTYIEIQTTESIYCCLYVFDFMTDYLGLDNLSGHLSLEKSDCLSLSSS